jgi:hypothetical protein
MDKLRTRFQAAPESSPTPPLQSVQSSLQLTDRYLGRLCFIRKDAYLVGYSNVAEGHDPSALAAALAARLP